MDWRKIAENRQTFWINEKKRREELEVINESLLDALKAMHDEFGINFPDGESTIVDGARAALHKARMK